MTVMTSEKCKYCGLNYKTIKVFDREILAPVCDCAKIEDEKRNERINYINNLRRKYSVLNIPRVQRGWRLKRLNCEYIDIAWKYINNFQKYGKMRMIFIGSTGNGKTTLAYCIAKELLIKGFTSVIKTYDEYLADMQRAELSKYHDENKETYLRDLNKNDLIIIDDFGREKYTDNRLVNTFSFFNSLINNCTNFIITANPENITIIKELPQFWAVFDRAAGGAKKLEFKNKSYRRTDIEPEWCL